MDFAFSGVYEFITNIEEKDAGIVTQTNQSEKKKKVLITASTFPRWEQDTEPRFILDFSKAMSAYYDITVLCPAAIGAKDEESLEGVKVIRYHYLPIHKWETLCYPGAIMPRIKERKSREKKKRRRMG